MEFVLDTHTHSIISGHAYSTIDENARFAAEKGLELLALTDHAPALKNTAPRAFFTNYSILPKRLHGIELLHGAELNILNENGDLDLDNELLSTLDIVIASLHPPCISPSSKIANTKAIINAMQNPNVDIMGHIGDPRYEIDVHAIFSSLKDTKCLFEINNNSLEKNGLRAGSDVYILEFLKLCMQDGVPVVLGSDAHFYTQIGDFENSVTLLSSINFPKELILNTSVDKFKNALKLNHK